MIIAEKSLFGLQNEKLMKYEVKVDDKNGQPLVSRFFSKSFQIDEILLLLSQQKLMIFPTK